MVVASSPAAVSILAQRAEPLPGRCAHSTARHFSRTRGIVASLLTVKGKEASRNILDRQHFRNPFFAAGRPVCDKRIIYDIRASTGSDPSSCPIDALIFDCDGVILESEDLHRCAYNATFENFKVCCPGSSEPVVWTTEFYDVLQNKIGGGKPKMRWYFNENGWPSSTVTPEAPESDEAKSVLIDTLQDWKTAKYKDMIGSGEVEPRPGVLRLMDEARNKGLKLAVCSAATKSSVIFVLQNLIGEDRFASLDCFLAGDDVDKKKPDPTIYRVASEKLGVRPERCLVVEDSAIGLQSALGAGMHCIATYTPSTKSQAFEGAAAVFPDLNSVALTQLLALPHLARA